MLTSFASIESVINASALGALSNAVLSYDNEGTSTEVTCVFSDSRNEPDAIGTPRGARLIVAEVLESDLGGIVSGKAVAIRSVAYSVARVERDKTGWVKLHLRTEAA